MKNYLQYVVMFFLLLLYSGCEKCESQKLGELNFTPEDLSVNPYTGNDTLRFRDNNNRIITYSARYRKSNRNEYAPCFECSCAGFYDIESGNNTFFFSDDDLSNIQVVISMNYDIGTMEKTSANLAFSWNSYVNNVHSYFPGFFVDSMKEHAIAAGLFREKILLRDKTFNDVYVAIGGSSKPDSLHPDTLYFSQAGGIVGVNYSDGNLWVVEQ